MATAVAEEAEASRVSFFKSLDRSYRSCGFIVNPEQLLEVLRSNTTIFLKNPRSPRTTLCASIVAVKGQLILKSNPIIKYAKY